MEENLIETEGVKLMCRSWLSSSKTAPHILALHGFSGDGLDYLPLIERTRQHFSWHTVDLPGHGSSDSPESAACYTSRAMLRMLRKIEERLSLDDYLLAGYSMGGRLALSYALSSPVKLRSLVLISAHPGLVDPVEREERSERDQQLAEHILNTDMKEFTHQWMGQDLLKSQAKIDMTYLPAMRKRRYRNNAAGLAYSLIGFGAGTMPPLWHALGALSLPLLLVSGSEDLKYTVIARKMNMLLPHAERTQFFDAGHTPHLEKPERFIRLLEGFTTEKRCRVAA